MKYDNLLDKHRNPYAGRFRTTQNNNPYGFTGQRFEAEVWMYSFAYRTYNPVSKRWLTPDPIRDGMNWYQYVRSDPVNLWDPLVCVEKDMMKIIHNNLCFICLRTPMGHIVFSILDDMIHLLIHIFTNKRFGVVLMDQILSLIT